MGQDRSGLQSGSSTPRPPQLVVLGGGVQRERVDAARNRRKVLAAAEALFAERGVAGVTMDDVAAAAGVGKGTLYRRFTDKGGLAVALLDERERELQERILSGPPPLGPGAPPLPRLSAFVAAYVQLLSAQLDLVLMSETSSPGARLRTGAHGFWRQHCRYLLDEVGTPDAELRAEVLLAGLSAEQVRHWLVDRQVPVAALVERLSAAATALSSR